MALDIAFLIVGMALLVKGADLFVSGASAVAKALRIPSLIIGLTLVSMGTSAPEASVSITGAIGGKDDMSVANVVGSNIVNTLFIIGISAAVVPLSVSRDVKRYDIPCMLGGYALLILFLFGITPHVLDVYESAILLVAFVGYTAFLFVRARRSKGLETSSSGERAVETVDGVETLAERKHKRSVRFWLVAAIGGLGAVILGGDLVVEGAAAVASALGMSETLIGLTVLAVGTSLPELVTSVVASVKRENDIAVGNVVGSNIFNTLFILGSSSAINSLAVGPSALVDTVVMLGSGAVLLAAALFGKRIARWQGAAMMLMYVGYIVYIVIRN